VHDEPRHPSVAACARYAQRNTSYGRIGFSHEVVATRATSPIDALDVSQCGGKYDGHLAAFRKRRIALQYTRLERALCAEARGLRQSCARSEKEVDGLPVLTVRLPRGCDKAPSKAGAKL
jgi:hypothetical protein